VETKPLAILAAGGTGGHMFPAQALAEELLFRGWEVKLSTDLRGARFTQNFPREVKIEIIHSATFAKNGLISKIKVPFLILGGIFATLIAFWKKRPNIVIGFGGYPTIPALTSSIFMSLPRIVHEQNGVLGKVNQLFSKKVHLVACGTWPTIMPEQVISEHIGNPVRKEVISRSGSPYIPPGNHPMSILILGGSQGATILSNIVPEAICTLPNELLKYIRVFQQAREEDCQRVRSYYLAKGITCEVLPFFDNIASYLAKHSLLFLGLGHLPLLILELLDAPQFLFHLVQPLETNKL